VENYWVLMKFALFDLIKFSIYTNGVAITNYANYLNLLVYLIHYLSGSPSPNSIKNAVQKARKRAKIIAKEY
jgi:hypothetical protein